MSSSRSARRRGRVRHWAPIGTVAILAVSLAGCSSGSDPGSASGSAAPALSGEVAALDQPLGSYPVPKDAIKDVASLKGTTVYYIPITLQSPQFGSTQKAVAAAAAAAGLTVQVCDGKGTPTDINACVAQATSAKAGAIISDAIPYRLAAGSFEAAQKAGIPVILNSQIEDGEHPASATLAYIGTNAGTDQQIALAKWVIGDSGAKADVLINQTTDGPSPVAYVAAGKKVYASDCADCTVAVNEVSSANFSLVPSSTSAALLKNPGVTYVESQFEQFLQPTQAGIKSTAKTGIKVITGSVGLSGLKALHGGEIAAASGQATTYQAWVDVDAALRMMLGSQAPSYDIPVRLFTKDSVAGLTLTDDAWVSGEWFGPTTFAGDFTKLWGVA
jgi:ribose transport system substrate-binding protein